MVVLIAERAPAGLCGEFSRWLTRVGTGVYLGVLSAEVRQMLWEHALRKAPDARFVMIHSCRGEPGYAICTHGYPEDSLVDLDGIPAIATRDAAWLAAMARFAHRADDT